MLAADGKLFVVTREGRIYAFGREKPAAPAQLARPDASPPAEDLWTARTAGLLERTQATAGYALVLGVGTGRLAEELLRQSRLRVIGVDEDADRVAALREKFYRAGLYGTRISLHEGNPVSFPFPPYLASLIVSEDLDPTRTMEIAVARAQLLRPYGGVACLAFSGERTDTSFGETPSSADESPIPHPGDMNLEFLTRAGPLPGADDWSHLGADAANSGASDDTFVRAPLGLLWFDGSLRYSKQHGAVHVRVAGGRLLILAGKLRAIDVYTGRGLWETALPSPRGSGGDMVALDEKVYVASGRSLVVLDAATGRESTRINPPAEIAGAWSNIRIAGDALVGTCGKHLVRLRLPSREVVWQHRFDRAGLALAVGGGKVFCAELPDRRKGKAENKTRAFDLESGKLVWELDGGSEVRYGESADLVVLASGVYRAGDGTRVRASAPESLVVGDKLLGGTDDSFVVYDLRTGEKLSEELKWNRRGCTRPLRACPSLVTTRFLGNAAYVDLAENRHTPLWNIRAGCNNNLYPANGVLNVPSLTFGCTCNYMPTSQAFAPLAVIERVAGTRPRLLRTKL
jgi:outer membrane protein assembly factor BamB